MQSAMFMAPRIALSLAVSVISLAGAELPSSARVRGVVKADGQRPSSFPHRIWAACDFEGQTPDYGWFGPAETNNLPRYPGNATALGVGAQSRPYQRIAAVMTGINPVPGPRMGQVNQLYLRYFLTGTNEATFQHFSLTREDNQHIRVTGLTEGRWSEVTLNFTRDARRNDGSPEPFGDGERMDDFKMFAGRPEHAARCQLFIDDVIFFANDPALPPESEPFPNRVILLAAFDTGPKEKYWPGDFEIVEEPPAGAYWRAARAVPARSGRGKLVRIQITPVRPVGARTKLRFRYHLTGASALTAQLFDATVQDNRHVRLTNLTQGRWTTAYVDFTRDARRNDGTRDTFTAGNIVDDLFFFLTGEGADQAELYVDEVALFDAAAPRGKSITASLCPVTDDSSAHPRRDVLWCHPAFANRRACVHKGQELVYHSGGASRNRPEVLAALGADQCCRASRRGLLSGIHECERKSHGRLAALCPE